MKILVVGGAGLIGSSLAGLLMKDGHEVMVLDNFTSNSLEHAELDTTSIITGNAGSFNTVNKVFALFKPQAVFHFADNSYDKEGTYDSSLESSTAVSVSANIIRCISIYKPEFVFLGSSGEVYKGGSKRRVSEKSSVGHFSYTGATKLYLENMFYLASKQYEFVFTSLRFFQVFGPRRFLNPKHDVTTFFIDSILRNEGVILVGPDTYIDILGFTEAAQASYLIFNTVTAGTVLNSVNIGSGQPIKLYDLYCSLVDNLIGGTRNVFKVPPRRQTRSLVADTGKLETIGWKPPSSVEPELINTVSHREKIIHAALR